MQVKLGYGVTFLVDYLIVFAARGELYIVKEIEANPQGR